MIPPLDNKYYTIKFACNYATTIPCHPKSEDVGQTYTIDKPCPQCLPHPYLVNAIFDRAHYNEMQALKKARGETIVPSSCDINQSLSSKLLSIDDDSKSISGRSVSSTSSSRNFIKSSFQILKSVVTRPRRKKIPTPAVQIIITPPEEDTPAEKKLEKVETAEIVAQDLESRLTVSQEDRTAVEETTRRNEEMPAPEEAEEQKTGRERGSSDPQWESFLKKANEIQSQLQQDKDEETKRKQVEQKLEEAEREVVLEKVKAVEMSLEQLS